MVAIPYAHTIGVYVSQVRIVQITVSEYDCCLTPNTQCLAISRPSSLAKGYDSGPPSLHPCQI